MGELISLEAHRQAKANGGESRAARARVVFYFDLASPHTYLAAERVDRMFPGLEWRPAVGDALYAGNPVSDAAVRERAQSDAVERAHELRMPLVWPDRYPAGARAAMRVAMLAAEDGRAAPFVLAASRLAFCGGFDLDDPEVLAEAAAAAGVSLARCLQAVGDSARDEQLETTARRLAANGADRLPAVRVGRLLVCGEERIGEAAACISDCALRGAPPVGESVIS
jgi:2-hydroxychromene-2-carboxylate isomerase